MEFAKPAEIVKGYTTLMRISETELALLMARIDVDIENRNLESIGESIQQWCYKGVKAYETSFSVEENVENEVSITKIDKNETPEYLVEKFFENLSYIRKWQSYQKFFN